jgi:hypothetical protein
MRLTLAEIRNRAIQFGHDWKDETSERAEAQTFWNEFFNVFGIHRRSVASFERTVKNLEGAYDRIDVIWQGVLIGEHKSKGQDLSKATTQALGYIQSLTREHRDSEIPRYIVISDFGKIVLHDLESTDPLFESVSFRVEDLHQHIRLFDFLNGIQSKPADPEDPINITAVEVLGELHDSLETSGYSGHRLERLLVRVLFCLFADDTGIFEPDSFKLLVEESYEDGSDLGPQLDRFFKVLDTPETSRGAKLPDALKALPYVNGNLFAERLDLADFDADTRNALLTACRFQWAKISPAVFGSLFQSIMAGETGARKRRQIGAHYTSERDILKLVRSLFLDDLRAEFERIKYKKKELESFHKKLATLKFLDPACGCGNFLVVAYRELRRLEHDVIEREYDNQHALINMAGDVRMDVDQMHGIEIEEWPVRIAEVAMWLIDHQMNQEASQKFGKPLLRLPLKKSAKIVHDNALRLDWNDVLPASECSFVMGNPPFVGQTWQTQEQKDDQRYVMAGISARGALDFVSNWYVKACQYSQGTPIQSAFVSTNSITQGEQVGILWLHLFAKYKVKIQFAHRTFAWVSEARGKAHVHVVIVGFAAVDRSLKVIFDYDADPTAPTVAVVKNISPYLIEGPDRVVQTRTLPLCAVPKMSWGNKPTDGGHFIMDAEQKEALLAVEPKARRFVRPYMSGGDFIDGETRYCLWLVDAKPDEIRSLPEVMKRVEAVKKSRMESQAPTTRAYARYPTLFRQIAQPNSDYLAIPEVSSERREFIPIAYLSSSVICSNKIQFIPDATPFQFGILTSTMHMAWTRQVAGRLESRISYSNSLVYNNYPWPTAATDAQKLMVEQAAQGVLDARAAFSDQTLADLYDPLAMPKALRDAHRTLDKAVDKCYRRQTFDSDRLRVEYLFGLYDKLTSLFTPTKPARRKKKSILSTENGI